MTNNKQKITERESTSVVVIILAVVSILLFTFGATALSIWITETENEKRINSEEMQVIQAVRTHYDIQPSNTDNCTKIKQVNEKSYYIVVLGERVFRVEGYKGENDSQIYNIKEME